MADTTDDKAAAKTSSPSPSSTSTASAASVEGNTAVTQYGGDHDRVTMLSLNVDGTPDQVDPEIIGDKEWAVAAAKTQFAQQAVAAVDAVERPLADTDDEPEQKQDASIAALKEKHDAAAEAAEQAAEQAVNGLHQG